MLPPVTALLGGAYLFFRTWAYLPWWWALVLAGLAAVPLSLMWTKIEVYAVGVAYFFLFLIVFDVVSWGVWLVCGRQMVAPAVWLYRTMLVPVLCAVVFTSLGVFHAVHVVRTDYTVTTSKALRAGGYQIAVLSDVHFGHGWSTAGMVQHVADEISALNVDLVLFVGDITDEQTTPDQVTTVWRILSGIKCRSGRYFIPGNHDAGLITDENAWAVPGVTLLRDTAVDIGDDLCLIGRQDASQPRADVSALLPQDTQKTIIVADHQPREFAAKAAAGVDLQISGHTHGGQLFPMNWLMQWFRMNDQVYGQKRVQQMTAITSSGVLGSHPLRTAAKSEYVIISLQSA